MCDARGKNIACADDRLGRALEPAGRVRMKTENTFFVVFFFSFVIILFTDLNACVGGSSCII